MRGGDGSGDVRFGVDGDAPTSRGAARAWRRRRSPAHRRRRYRRSTRREAARAQVASTPRSQGRYAPDVTMPRPTSQVPGSIPGTRPPAMPKLMMPHAPRFTSRSSAAASARGIEPASDCAYVSARGDARLDREAARGDDLEAARRPVRPAPLTRRNARRAAAAARDSGQAPTRGRTSRTRGSGGRTRAETRWR